MPDGDLAGDSLSIADAQHGGALELVDLAGTQDGPEAVIAGNIFHRAVAFGPCQPGLPADGLDVRVLIDGEVRAAGRATDDLTARVVCRRASEMKDEVHWQDIRVSRDRRRGVVIEVDRHR